MKLIVLMKMNQTLSLFLLIAWGNTSNNCRIKQIQKSRLQKREILPCRLYDYSAKKLIIFFSEKELEKNSGKRKNDEELSLEY